MKSVFMLFKPCYSNRWLSCVIDPSSLKIAKNELWFNEYFYVYNKAMMKESLIMFHELYIYPVWGILICLCVSKNSWCEDVRLGCIYCTYIFELTGCWKIMLFHQAQHPEIMIFELVPKDEIRFECLSPVLLILRQISRNCWWGGFWRLQVAFEGCDNIGGTMIFRERKA